MVDRAVLDYIRDMLERGYSTRLLRKMFLKKGYDFREIDEAIKTVYNEVSFEKEFMGKEKSSQAGESQNSSPASGFDSTSMGQGEPEDNMRNLVKQKFTRYSQENQSPQDNGLYARTDSFTGQQQNPNYAYSKENRPSRRVLHSSLHKLSGNLSSHNKIFVIGTVILVFILILLTASVVFMYLDLKESYEREKDINRQEGRENIISCGVCEYYEADECKRYNCCSNQDCDDGDKNTVDRCILASTKDSRCVHTNLSQVGPAENRDEKDEQEAESKQEKEENPEKDIPVPNSSITGQTCETEAECDDNNPATNDMCLGSPEKLCINLPIRSCIPGDDYCPPGCTGEKDSDCQGS